MSDMDQTTPPAPIGRIVVELTSSGNLVMEYYTNGVRTRTNLDRGGEWWQIMDELHAQRRNSETSTERKQAQKDAEAIATYERVYNQTAKNHGKKFANKHIRTSYGTNFIQVVEISGPPNPARELKPGIAATDISDMVRVCHCGAIVAPFMEKCDGCPGHSGAGKIVRYTTRGREVKPNEAKPKPAPKPSASASAQLALLED